MRTDPTNVMQKTAYQLKMKRKPKILMNREQLTAGADLESHLRGEDELIPFEKPSGRVLENAVSDGGNEGVYAIFH